MTTRPIPTGWIEDRAGDSDGDSVAGPVAAPIEWRPDKGIGTVVSGLVPTTVPVVSSGVVMTVTVTMTVIVAREILCSLG